ncbi:MAG: aminopeptidase P family protein, partial [bacterium]|nr:aminopeptidase P family protein [bacterium]
YGTQASQEVSGFRLQVLKQGERMMDRVERLVKKGRIKRLGFEPADLKVQSYLDLKKRLSPCRMVPMKKGVEFFRMVKTPDELEKIVQAIRHAEKAFLAAKKAMVEGVLERDVALKMEYGMRKNGALHIAFDTIVGSGERGAMPHGIASDKRLKRGELIVVDFGAESEGYFSDMTRTLYLGKRLTGKKRKIHDIVREAQATAIEAVRPGVTFAEIDGKARDLIKKAGFGKYFGHGTGHGIGLEVHEAPYVSVGNRQILEEGMVFTVEPGIYLPGLGGVRIEDMVLVTGDGCRSLTSLPKGWEI